MRNFAFKRAKSNPAVLKSLPPEFIVEFADTTLFPEGFHRVEDGFEILPEDEFEKEYAKNKPLHEAFLAKKIEQQKLAFQAEAAAQEKALADEKVAKREFELFQKWRESKRKLTKKGE